MQTDSTINRQDDKVLPTIAKEAPVEPAEQGSLLKKKRLDPIRKENQNLLSSKTKVDAKDIYSPYISELKKRLHSREHWDAVIFFLSAIIYCSIIFSQFQINNRFNVNKSLSDYYGFRNDSFKYISNEDIVYYFDKILDKHSNESFWFWDRKYDVISPFRCTQRRIKVLPPTKRAFTCQTCKTMLNLATDRIDPKDEFSPDVEESSPFESFSFNKTESFMGKGGYVMSYTKLDIITQEAQNAMTEGNMELYANITQANMNSIKQKFRSFITNSTSSIVFDFMIANHELGYLCNVIITYNYSPIGLATLSFEINMIDTKIYSSSGSNVRAATEAIFLVILIYYIYFDSVGYKLRTDLEYLKHLREIELENHSRTKQMTLNTSTSMKFTKIEQKTKFKIFIKVFTGDLLCLIHIISFIFTIVNIILWIIFVIYLGRNMTQINSALSSVDFYLPLTSQNDLLFASYALENYRSIVTINFFFIFIKLVKILFFYIPSTFVFVKTIGDAISDLVSFCIFFFTIIIGFSFFALFYYGRYLSSFGVFFDALQQNFSFALGIIQTDVYKEMYKADSSITIVYFILNIIFVKFIITVILLAIIMHSFKSANDHFYIRHKSKFDPFKIKRSEKIKNLFVRVLNLFNECTQKLWSIIVCSCKKKSTVYSYLKEQFNYDFTQYKIKKIKCPEMKKIEEKDEEISLLIKSNREGGKKNERDLRHVKDIDLYNSKYFEDYAYTIRNAYFDSNKDYYKVRNYFENKYRRVLVKSLSYIVFAFIFIFMFFLNVLSPWHAIVHNYFINKFKQLKSGNVYYPEYKGYEINFFEINKTETAKNFTFDYLPNMFTPWKSEEATYYILTGDNYVVNNSISITTRIQNNDKTSSTLNSNGTMKEDFGTRMYEPLSLFKMINENKTLIELNATDVFNNTRLYQIPYDRYTTYKTLGGYPFRLDLTQAQLHDGFFPPKEVQDLLISPYVNFVVIEFVLLNDEYQSIIYVKMEIKVDYGTHYFNTIETSMIKFDQISSGIDKTKIVLEVIFVIIWVYLWVMFIQSIKQENLLYDKWYRDKIKTLNIKVQDLRNFVSPEFLRKIACLFEVNKICELVILVLCGYLIYLRIYLSTIIIEIQKVYSVSVVDYYPFRDYMYQAIDLQASYDVIGTLIIFICFFRFIGLLNLGKYFSLLIKTFADNNENNVTFITLLFAIQPGFLLYVNISFGEKNKDYSDLGKAFISLVQVLFGYVDFRELARADSVFGPIFFFLYLIVINLILINLFVSIIYSSYVKIKSEIQRSVEIWSPKNVFLLCCYKPTDFNEKENRNNKHNLTSEFDFEKRVKRFETHMNIHEKNLSLKDWLKFENIQIKLLDDGIFNIYKRRHDILTAYHARNSTDGYIFEDNLYRNIETKNLKSFYVYYLDFILSVIDSLENDILIIERHSRHLNSHKEYMKYEEVIQRVVCNNDATRRKIAELDKQFVELKFDLEKMYRIERIDEIKMNDINIKDKEDSYDSEQMNVD